MVGDGRSERDTDAGGRPHTGRRRNDAARAAILDATRELLRERGYERLTIAEIARAAGVGKQTIYRWWRNRADIVLEVARERARDGIGEVDTGTLRGDLDAFMTATYATAADPAMRALLRGMAAAAEGDAEFEAAFKGFVDERRAVLAALVARGVERGELAAEADLELIVDVVFGLLWYAVVAGRELPGRARTRRLVAQLLAGATAAPARSHRRAG